jgi:hypothetical protein
VSEAVEREELGAGSQDQVLLLRCAWCERIKSGDTWIASTEVPVDEVREDTPLTHGICPDCHAKLGPL